MHVITVHVGLGGGHQGAQHADVSRGGTIERGSSTACQVVQAQWAAWSNTAELATMWLTALSAGASFPEAKAATTHGEGRPATPLGMLDRFSLHLPERHRPRSNLPRVLGATARLPLGLLHAMHSHVMLASPPAIPQHCRALPRPHDRLQ